MKVYILSERYESVVGVFNTEEAAKERAFQLFEQHKEYAKLATNPFMRLYRDNLNKTTALEFYEISEWTIDEK